LVVLGGLLQKANGHLSILATQIPDPLT
jgi:hypothetical protein